MSLAEKAPESGVLSSDWQQVDRLIATSLKSPVPLMQEVISQLICNHGKRLRSQLLLLIAKAWQYQGDEHWELAAVVEMLHEATLVHDDVVDESDLRRGKPSIKAGFGNPASVLVGDFLYAQAFLLLSRRANIPAMQIFARTTVSLSEGEMLQLMNPFNILLSEHEYEQIISHKTADLFAACGQLAALVADIKPDHCEAMRKMGWHLGMCFQIQDDIMDYKQTAGGMGKQPGDDWVEGRITLPLIKCYQAVSDEQKDWLTENIQKRDRADLPQVLKLFEQTECSLQALARADFHFEQALQQAEVIPPSDAREHLLHFLAGILKREY